MNAHVERGILLYQQSRHELAEKELRQALSIDPQDVRAHAFLALCLSARERFAGATMEARQAVHLAPDAPFVHFVLASVCYDRDRYGEALAAINEAIRLDPTDATYFALLSGIHLEERRWPEALHAAERGLALDPEHVGCTNLRAMALVKLGRKGEAAAAIDTALAKAPDNSQTHASLGWVLLEQSKPKQAVEHFREALRLDPENEWARAGVVEALKARNILYGGILRYFLWMSKLSGRAQWGIILGGYFGIRYVSAMAQSNPALAPWLLPLRILYVAFVVLTWTAYPMFNLLLRFNRFGRLALTRAQNVEANWVGACLLLAMISLAGCVVMGFDSPWIVSFAVFGLLLLPLSGFFRCPKGWPQKTMLAVVLVLLLIGCTAIVLIWHAHFGDKQYEKETSDSAFGLLTLFSVGILLSTLLGNILVSRRPTR